MPHPARAVSLLRRKGGQPSHYPCGAGVYCNEDLTKAYNSNIRNTTLANNLTCNKSYKFSGCLEIPINVQDFKKSTRFLNILL
jgi:hypothetical protein